MDFDIKGIKGLEEFDKVMGSTSNAFLTIVNSTKQISKVKEINPAAQVSMGDVFNTKTGEVLAKQGQPLHVVLVKPYKVWNVWSADRQLVKYTFDIDGQAWSDGSPILPEHKVWTPDAEGRKRPYATETLTFVVVTKSELPKESPEFVLLSFSLTNKAVKEFTARLSKLIKENAKNHAPEYLHELAFELTTDIFKNQGGDTWYDWATVRCTHKIKPENSQKLIPVYEETKDFNKATFTVNPALLLAAKQDAPSNDVPMMNAQQPVNNQQQAIQPPTTVQFPTSGNVQINTNPEF